MGIEENQIIPYTIFITRQYHLEGYYGEKLLNLLVLEIELCITFIRFYRQNYINLINFIPAKLETVVLIYSLREKIMKTFDLDRKKHVQHLLIALVLFIFILSTGSASAGPYLQGDGEEPDPEYPLAYQLERMPEGNQPMASAGSSSLQNQLDHRSSWGIASTQFHYAYSDYDAEAADDFTVPASDGSWIIDQVDIYGWCVGNIGEYRCTNLDYANVRIYKDNGGKPGDEVYSAEMETITDGSLIWTIVQQYSVELTVPAVLAQGTYWISVQVKMETPLSDGIFYWNQRTVQSGNDSVVRNPGGAFYSGCFDWCDDIQAVPDLNFMLTGRKGNPSKTEIPTGEVFALVEHGTLPLLYTTIPSSNEVVVVNTNTESIVTAIPLGGSNPQGMAISADNSKVFVALQGGSAIKVISTTTNTVTDTFLLPYQPEYVAYGGPGRIYITDDSINGDIESRDPSTGALIGTLPHENYTGDLLAVSRDGNTLCSARTGQSPASLACYDISTDSPPAAWTTYNIGGNLQTIDISGDDAYVYTACGSPYQITAYHLSTLSQAGTFDTGAYPDSGYDSFEGDKVFISGADSAWTWNAQTYQKDNILDHNEVRILGGGKDNVTAFATYDDKLIIYHFTSFLDLSWTHWAKNWIEALYNEGITSGYPDGTYRPENPVTRAEMAVFLLNGMGVSVPPSDGSHNFSDISGHWAENYIEELYDLGITGGYPDGTYRPENLVTRAEMAVFLLKGMAVSPPAIDGSHPFTDVAGHWAEVFIEELFDQGITGGYPDGTYRPENRVTRAEMAVFLVNAFNIPLP